MKIDLDIILNVFIGMFLYNMVLTSLGKALLNHFLNNSETIQKEKKSFREKLKAKLDEREKSQP
jgi:hypothetical protein